MEIGSLPQQPNGLKGEFGIYDHCVLKTPSLQPFAAHFWEKKEKPVCVSLVFVVCFSSTTCKYTPFLYVSYIKIYMYMYGEIYNIYIICRDLFLQHI